MMARVPSFLDNLLRFYNALDSKAITTEDGTRVFEGHTTSVLQTLDPPLSMSHYTRIRRALLAMDCIAQVSRGSRNSKTVWVLIQPPKQELLDAADPAMIAQGKDDPSKLAILSQRIEDLQKQLGGFDVVKAMQDLEGRIIALEDRLNKQEKKKNGS
jgi:hypothetical protein